MTELFIFAGVFACLAIVVAVGVAEMLGEVDD